MKQLIVILFCAFSLSAYASYFEVQVPMSSQSSTYAVHTTSSAQVTTVGGGAYHPSQTVINMQSTARQIQTAAIPSGRFTTYVPAVGKDGHAYFPGQATTSNSGPHRAKRVLGEDEDDERETEDPFMPSQAAPIGDTPWWFILLLSFACVGYKRRQQRKKASF